MTTTSTTHGRQPQPWHRFTKANTNHIDVSQRTHWQFATSHWGTELGGMEGNGDRDGGDATRLHPGMFFFMFLFLLTFIYYDYTPPPPTCSQTRWWWFCFFWVSRPSMHPHELGPFSKFFFIYILTIFYRCHHRNNVNNRAWQVSSPANRLHHDQCGTVRQRKEAREQRNKPRRVSTRHHDVFGPWVCCFITIISCF